MYDIYITNYSDKAEISYPPEIDIGDMITNKEQALEITTHLVTKWGITPQDFIDAYKKELTKEN